MPIDPDDVPVCDGHVNAEKLSELMAVGTERPSLDYKATINLHCTKDLVEFVRDVAAMSSNPKGGYLVYGLDDAGHLATDVTAIEPEQFDEADLRNRAQRYLGRDFDLTVGTHVVNGHAVAVVYVKRARFGMSPMECDGNYTDQGRAQTRFRKGDVFIRRGTQVDKVNASDIPRLLEPDIEQAKEIARQEIARAFARTQVGETGAGVAQGPPGAITWRLPQAEFEGAILHAIRASDRVALRAALLPLSAEAASMVANAGRVSDLHTLLNRVTSIAAIALTYENPSLFNRALQILKGIYSSVTDADGYPRHGLAISAAELWLAVGIRIEALGGLAIRLQRWSVVRALALVPSCNNYYVSWLRQAQVEAARNRLLANGQGEFIPGAFAGAAREVVKNLPALRPDAPDETLPDFSNGQTPSDNDLVLDSILQFDLAWCVLVYLVASNEGDVYPSFATFYVRRVAPLLNLIATDAQARSELLELASESDIRKALRAVLTAAGREASRYGHMANVFTTRALAEFLAEDAPQG